MPPAQEWVIFATLGAVTLGLVVLLFVAGGPFGWFTAVFMIIGFLLLASWSGFFQSDELVEKVNCPDCGARNRTDRMRCSHCGVLLDHSAREDDE
ncbi:zinc ribbon domain-containing protein [Natrarchaeobius sp. A-rgal3]|uniref:zinc ribbon domain-containing protein n=1 Tax=Natrarchaeobius versutus TaxID=1679078 RepID=UPI0035100575